MLVYIENAHNIRLYKPVLYYNGNSIQELEDEIRNYLDIGQKRDIKVIMYDKRSGCSSRHMLTSLENQTMLDVYVKLKLEDGHQ